MTLHPSTGRARFFQTARALCGSAVLLLAACALAHADAVKLSVVVKQDLYEVHGEFDVAASGAIAWDVLTDYDNIGRFVPTIRASSVSRDSAGHLVVQQTAAAGVFPFKKTVRVRLIVEERERDSIVFRDTLATDFRDYRGSWQLIADSTHSRVIYKLEARPRVAAPHMLARALMSHDVNDLLEEVRTEMLRRVQTGAWSPGDDD